MDPLPRLILCYQYQFSIKTSTIFALLINTHRGTMKDALTEFLKFNIAESIFHAPKGNSIQSMELDRQFFCEALYCY